MGGGIGIPVYGSITSIAFGVCFTFFTLGFWILKKGGHFNGLSFETYLVGASGISLISLRSLSGI
jgi:hypothetical protein